MQKKIKILGVPMDLGQFYRGVSMGSAALAHCTILDFM
jgi:arginase family enzyme